MGEPNDEHAYQQHHRGANDGQGDHIGPTHGPRMGLLVHWVINVGRYGRRQAVLYDHHLRYRRFLFCHTAFFRLNQLAALHTVERMRMPFVPASEYPHGIAFHGFVQPKPNATMSATGARTARGTMGFVHTNAPHTHGPRRRTHPFATACRVLARQLAGAKIIAYGFGFVGLDVRILSVEVYGRKQHNQSRYQQVQRGGNGFHGRSMGFIRTFSKIQPIVAFFGQFVRLF